MIEDLIVNLSKGGDHSYYFAQHFTYTMLLLLHHKLYEVYLTSCYIQQYMHTYYSLSLMPQVYEFNASFSPCVVTFSAFTCTRELLLNNYNYLQVWTLSLCQSNICLSLVSLHTYMLCPLILSPVHQCPARDDHHWSVLCHTVCSSVQPYWSLQSSPGSCQRQTLQ